MKRRTLLLSGLGATGALIVGWGMLPPRSRLGRPEMLIESPDNVALNGWIKIGRDGGVLLAMNRSEMGQGVHTALAMLVAEEMDVPLARVRLIPAGYDAIYGNVAMFVGSLPFHPKDTEPGKETRLASTGAWLTAKLARELGINATGGSSTVADAWEPLRQAAATARAQLLGAASLRWKQPVDELTVREGVISHAGSENSAHYGVFAEQAAATPPADVKVKERADWKLIGRATQRIDIAAKVDGSACFGLDVREADQLYAVIAHAPAIGGTPGRVDIDKVLAKPGVERVVRLGSFGGSTEALAVVARTTWHARQAVAAMDVEWRAPTAAPLDTRRILQKLEAKASDAAEHRGGFTFHSRGDVAKALSEAPRRVEAVYRAPYLAHTAMEPINCTARVKDGRVDVWASTQVPGLARDMAARVADVPVDNVSVHVTYLGGGFGRRLDVDFVGQAVRIALETGGRPVQLVWPREEDVMHDFYRPAGVAVLRAALDAQGMPQGLLIASAGDAITPRWIERGLPKLTGPVDAPDKTTSEGLFDIPYGIAHQRIAHVATNSGVPVGFWRSVGHSHNAFFSECFIDELAAEAKMDAVAFRLALLKDAPRHAAVLKLAAEKAGWGTALPAGSARGVALHESFGSVVAQVLELSLTGKTPRVKRVVCAIDCGTVVNPGIVAQQMESAVVFGLSAALWGRVDIEDGIVRQRNFGPDPAAGNVRLLRLSEMPLIETHIVASHRAPSGVGEPGTPPVAPALANALFALTGTRARELPLSIPGLSSVA